MTDDNPEPIPPAAWPILLFARRIERNLRRIRAAGLVDPVPNTWQIALGVLRMWHRMIFRSETIGTSKGNAVRRTLRARLLQYRPLRAPFLIAERAIAPLDFSGLASSPERVIRHLLGAHHDGNQFAYDLQMLSVHPGRLEELLERVRAVVERDDARSRWLRDLTVYEGYHDNLLAAVERSVERGVELPPGEADDPDISFLAYLRWCALQPATPEATLAALRAGTWSLTDPLPATQDERVTMDAATVV